jgi:hypothetical protein
MKPNLVTCATDGLAVFVNLSPLTSPLFGGNINNIGTCLCFLKDTISFLLYHLCRDGNASECFGDVISSSLIVTTIKGGV